MSQSSANKVLEILASYSHERPVRRITEISKDLGIPKSTVSRLVQELVSEGYLIKVPSSQGYMLGPTVNRLGGISLSRTKIVHEVSPLLNKLVVETKESAHIAILEGYDIVYIAKNASPYYAELTSDIGVSLPAHATSAGKILLSDKDEEYISDMFEHGIQKITDKTLGTYDKFLLELDQVRNQGYAFSVGELDSDNFSGAVPVFDENERIACAISVAGPLARRSSPEKEKNFINLMLEVADEASERLSYAEEGYY